MFERIKEVFKSWGRGEEQSVREQELGRPTDQQPSVQREKREEYYTYEQARAMRDANPAYQAAEKVRDWMKEKNITSDRRFEKEEVRMMATEAWKAGALSLEAQQSLHATLARTPSKTVEAGIILDMASRTAEYREPRVEERSVGQEEARTKVLRDILRRTEVVKERNRDMDLER